MPDTIVLLDPMPPDRVERMRAHLPAGFVLTAVATDAEEHLCERIAEADYAIAGQVPISRRVLGAARRLKLLHRWGVGVDHIDLVAAREFGIPVARTAGSNAGAVAEFALGLILSTLRGIPLAQAELARGVWRGGRVPLQTFRLSGKTVGIVGLGAIGSRLAELLRGFGCPILYTKRTRLDPGEEARLGVTFAALPELLATADVVTLSCPLTPETDGMIDARALGTMKRTAILVNVARGGVVVEADLVAALRAGTLHGAASDVFATEPLPADSPLLGLDNHIATPHLAAITADGFAPTLAHLFGNIARVARGEPVPARDLVGP